MPDANAETSPTPALPVQPAVLSYDTSAPHEPQGSRPAWVYVVFVIYAIAALALLSAPAWGSLLLHENAVVQGGVLVTGIALLGLSLIILPVKMVRRRNIRRRSIWIPILASGLLAGALVTGAAAAWCEYASVDGNISGPVIAYSGVAVWLVWSILFGWMALARGPQSIGMKLHRTLIAGSVLELLVAVPAHIVVRRRTECCAGIMTGTAICIGVIVMFVSFGPSVLLLYYQRRKKISRDRGESA